MSGSSFRRLSNHVHVLLRGRLSCFPIALQIVKGRSGLEIGGPSDVFREWYAPLPIYRQVASLDNCDYSPSTTWATHSNVYTFCSRHAPGKTIFCDGSDINAVSDGTYDFILSSHNLEHFANPVKALKEWRRVTKPGGGLILVLPDGARTFDRQRQPTPVSHMLEDFERNTQEDDLTHLPEILLAHDFTLDPDAGSPEEFRLRSENNFMNRCLHHHVFNPENIRALLIEIGLEVLAIERAWPNNIFVVARFLVRDVRQRLHANA